MSKEDKTIKRFLSFPKDYSYDELTLLLKKFGFEPSKTGKTGGSRRRFINNKTGDKFTMHKPHPGNVIKKYVLEELYEVLRKGGYLS